MPLARFYASHRGELPTIFRSIQIAPVWRAERPQKGRYRQFMQCDIDIIGESRADRRSRADHGDSGDTRRAGTEWMQHPDQ